MKTTIVLLALLLAPLAHAQSSAGVRFCKGQLATTEEERELEVQGFAIAQVLAGQPRTVFALLTNAAEIATVTRALHNKLEILRPRILDFCGSDPALWDSAVQVWQQALAESLSAADLIGIVPSAEARADYAEALRMPPLAP